MSAPIPVLVNRSGGTAASKGDKLEAEIAAAFAEAGVTIDLHLVEGEKLERTLKKVADQPLVVIGGGDGTLGRMAGLLAEKGTTLGILPLGTRNHLARELGLKIVVEGVETPEQLALLNKHRSTDLVQGYVFSPPVPSKEIGILSHALNRRTAPRRRSKVA